MNSFLFPAALFVGSIALMSISSYVLTGVLEKIGAGLQFPEGLLGIVTALGADAPEISSSITALAAGQHELGVGVVLGSNIFNLAALLGLSAIVAGGVRVTSASALFNGNLALLTTGVAALLLVGLLAPALAFFFILLLVPPYIYIVALSRTRIEHLPLPRYLSNFLARSARYLQEHAGKDSRPHASLTDWLTLLPALFGIIAGSRGTISATVNLAARFSISHAVAGTLVIAGLTGIPNAIAAISLATRRHDNAVETECFNSNTLNLMFGLCLPSLITGIGAQSVRTFFALAWLGLMTIVSIVLLQKRNGLRRNDGILLIALYAIFAGAIISWPTG